jgi:hypothetical protein
MHARLLHTSVCVRGEFVVEGPGCVGVGKDFVAGFDEREGEEGGADFGYDAAEDYLVLARCFDGGAEIGVVPGVDFALAVDEGCVGVQVDDFFGEGAVWTCRFFSGRYWLGEGIVLVPVSADVVKMVGRSKRFPIAAWAMMLWRNSTVL